MKHASIIPLIGGETIASEKVFGTSPDVLYSYSPFEANDSHLLNYYKSQNKDIPYIVLDKDQYDSSLAGKADVISAVCPCAGLSTLSKTSGANNPLNDWMETSARFVLGTLKPRVFWGENAPQFASKSGTKIREKIYKIGRENGYTMTVYKTRSLIHGLPQIRSRSFYFFWKETNQVPILQYYKRPMTSLEDLLDSVKSNFQTEVTNTKIPTEDKYYKFILERIHPGMTHAEFAASLEKSSDVMQYIHKSGYNFSDMYQYFTEIGDEKEAAKCARNQAKIDGGGGIMYRYTIIPRLFTGAFVGHLPTQLTHHKQDRYLNYRECMSIMGLPEDFELLNPKKSLNHICQNVPVRTAMDMATEVKAYLEGNRFMAKANMMFQSNDKKTEFIQEKDEETLEEHFA